MFRTDSDLKLMLVVIFETFNLVLYARFKDNIDIYYTSLSFNIVNIENKKVLLVYIAAISTIQNAIRSIWRKTFDTHFIMCTQNQLKLK